MMKIASYLLTLGLGVMLGAGVVLFGGTQLRGKLTGLLSRATSAIKGGGK